MSNRDLIKQIQNHIDNVDDPNASLLVARKLLVRIVADLEAHEWQDIDENTPREINVLVLLANGEVFRAHLFNGGWNAGTDIGWVNAKYWKHIQPPGDKDEPLEA